MTYRTNQTKCAASWSAPVLLLIHLTLAIHGGVANALPLQSWDTTIKNTGTRFVVLPNFNHEAVLDQETQLVWQRKPNSAPLRKWGTALNFCYGARTGGRGGGGCPSWKS